MKEILLDKNISEKDIIGMLHEIPVHQNKSHTSFIDACIDLKKEINNAQHNFHGLQLEDANHKLKKYHIQSIDDIHTLNDQLAVMEFDENDVLQALDQIQGVTLHEKVAVIP